MGSYIQWVKLEGLVTLQQPCRHCHCNITHVHKGMCALNQSGNFFTNLQKKVSSVFWISYLTISYVIWHLCTSCSCIGTSYCRLTRSKLLHSMFWSFLQWMKCSKSCWQPFLSCQTIFSLGLTLFMLKSCFKALHINKSWGSSQQGQLIVCCWRAV